MAKKIKDQEAYNKRMTELKKEASKDVYEVIASENSTSDREFARAYNEFYKKIRKGTSHINKQKLAGLHESRKDLFDELYGFVEAVLEEYSNLYDPVEEE